MQKVQKSMAFTYLKLGISTEEISYLLGYTEVSAFLRAFKKWTGKSIVNIKKDSKILILVRKLVIKIQKIFDKNIVNSVLLGYTNFVVLSL